MKSEVEEIINVIEEVANGNYSNQIMEFTKPGYTDTVQRIAESVGMMMVKVEAREHRLEQLIEELKELNQRIRYNALKTVASIATALGARDEYTKGHGVRVAIYAVRLAKRLGLPDKQIEYIRIGAVLHDIGKIGFSDRVFTNQDVRISEGLLEEIHRHPEIGVDILKNLDFLGPAIDYVHFHHERLDGSGYPRGLKGDQIPLGAQILSIADCFDAITTERSYQKGRNSSDGCAILRKLSGTHLAPQLVQAFVEEIAENGIVDASRDLLSLKDDLFSLLAPEQGSLMPQSPASTTGSL